jgi:hypothetical protein
MGRAGIVEVVESGVSIFWFTTGAILAFAIDGSPPGINLHVAGIILMVVGGVGITASVVDRLGLGTEVLERVRGRLKKQNDEDSETSD